MNRVEQFCNKVASEVLVPSEGLSQTWIAKQSIDQNVNRLVRIYRVSKYVVARQAYELDRITRPEYFDYLEQHKKLWRPQEDDPEDSDVLLVVRHFIRKERAAREIILCFLKEF